MSRDTRTAAGSRIDSESILITSPVPHLLGVNQVLSPSEKRKVQKAVYMAQRRIDDINTKILRLQNEGNALQSFRDAHLALLNLEPPPNTLLPELWSAIFLQYVRDTTPRISLGALPVGHDGFGRREGPLLLSHVCSSWRKIALSTPQLWAAITLNTGYRTPEARMELTEIWLNRSGTVPLEVRLIVSKAQLESTTPPSIDAATRRLISESHRWETFYSLSDSPLKDAWKLFTALRGNIPLLRKCTLTAAIIPPNPQTGINDQINLWDTAPSLRSIRMLHAPVFLSMIIPFEQLTTVDLLNEPYGSVGISMDACLQVLRRCPNLVDCSFCCGFRDSSLPEPEMFVHQNLQRLVISGENPDGGQLGTFFSKVACPSLHSLVIKTPWMGVSQWDHLEFIAFLAGIQCLESLEVVAREVSGKDALTYLRHTPFLRQMHMQLPAAAEDDVVQQLSGSPEDVWPSALPVLYYVVVHNSIFDALSAFDIGSPIYFPPDALSRGKFLRRAEMIDNRR